MALIHGSSGAVTWETQYTTHAFQWSLTWECEAHDTTEFGDTTKRFEAGLIEWSGSYTCYLDDTVFTEVPGQEGASMQIVLSGKDGDADATYNGDAICTNAGPTVEIDGMEQVTFNFVGDGDLTIGLPV